MTLRQALDLVITEHERIGSPLADYLMAPTPASVVQEELAALGLQPPSSLIELYAWSGGIDHDRWITYGHRGHLSLFDNASMTGVRGAAELCLDQREVAASLTEEEGGEAEDYWRSSWFSFLFADPPVYAIETTGEHQGAVWRVFWHPSRLPTSRAYETMEGLFEQVLKNFRAGAYRWRTDLEVLETVGRVDD